MTLRLAVTADDFGIGEATSAGIVRAHRHGPVTSTSLMTVTGDRARASVQLLSHAPDLEVGIHLVFTATGERPLRATAASGLTGRDGRFVTNGQLWMRAWTGRLDPAAVLDEIAAQAREFVELTGRPPAYADAHHHAHQLPVVRDMLVEAVRLGLLPAVTRGTLEPPTIRARASSARVRRSAAHLLGRSAAAVFDRAGLRRNGHFFGMLDPGDLLRDNPWAGYLRHLPASGSVEWVVHPGEPDDTLIGRDPYVGERVRELAALTSDHLRQAWQSRATLCRKSEIAGP